VDKPVPKTTSKFDAEYRKLNREQREAVDAIEGPVMVVAGPGTGKTHVLTMRIANIRRLTDTPPEAILALTFTEAAVAEMRKRLGDLMQSSSDAYHVTLNTFHGFANDIIRAYPESFPELAGGKNITEWEEVKIIERLVDTLDLEALRPRGHRFLYVKHALGALTKLKQEGVSPRSFEQLLAEEGQAFKNIPDLVNEKGKYAGRMKTKYQGLHDQIVRNKELVKLYRAYEEELIRTRTYDYADMILKVKSALETNEDLLRTLQEEYLYVLVDEHQDTNKGQNRVIELIASAWDEPNLFVVGDEEQAIYRFQGASLENFLYFQKRFKNVRGIQLSANYRSPQAVLDAAHHLTNPERPKKRLASTPSRDGKPITVFEFQHAEAEAYFITTHIAERIAKGAQPEDIAVLYRNNRDALPISRMLERLGIPYAVESGHDILNDEDMKKLVLILKAVQRYGAPEDLAPLLYVDFLGIPPLDAWKITSLAHREKPKLNLYDVIRQEDLLQKAGAQTPQAILELSRHLSLWKISAKNNGIIEAFADIVRESGFLKHMMNRPDGYEKLSKLHGLYEILKNLLETNRNYTLEDFFEYLALAEKYGLRLEGPAAHAPAGRIRLMTAHKSKGREFEYVYIANAEDKRWGHRPERSPLKLPRRVFALLEQASATLAESSEEDERHLFYVALTRAKREAVISYALRGVDGRGLEPSRFIELIQPEFKISGDAAPYEKEYDAKRTDLTFAALPPSAPNLKDKRFLNQLFREQGLSATALNNYLMCPWRYFFRSLVRVPEPPDVSLSYGSAVHAALEQYFDARRSTGKDPGEDYLLRRFEGSLRREPLRDTEHADAVKRGQKALSGYWKKYHSTWNTNVLTEERLSAQCTPDILINGKIDKIERIGPGKAVNVVDYKTGKIKTRGMIEGDPEDESEDAGGYKRQLVFYKLLLDRDGRFAMRSGEIDFVEPDRHGEYRKEAFTVTDEEVAHLEATIARVGQEILALAFWDRGACDDPRCPGCPLREMMA
jgi:DNA helicase-2/ATP-dependent DNA helicase PcrA